MNYKILIDLAEKILTENVKTDYLLLHSRTVAYVMNHYSNFINEEDKDLWYITGLIHDWDYEFDPAGHPEKNTNKLLEFGIPKIVVDAILGHKVSLGYSRESNLAKALLSIDELCGLFFAYKKMKLSYSAMDIAGVYKKFKDKSFAAKVSRQDILIGVDELGIDIQEHISRVLKILIQAETEGLF